MNNIRFELRTYGNSDEGYSLGRTECRAMRCVEGTPASNIDFCWWYIFMMVSSSSRSRRFSSMNLSVVVLPIRESVVRMDLDSMDSRYSVSVSAMTH